jgi:hypothetical protein
MEETELVRSCPPKKQYSAVLDIGGGKTSCASVALKTNCASVALKTNCASVALKTSCASVALKTSCTSVALKTSCATVAFCYWKQRLTVSHQSWNIDAGFYVKTNDMYMTMKVNMR